MPTEARLTHETSVKKFLTVKGMEGHVNLDGILGKFGIKPHETVARIHADRPEALDNAKAKIISALEMQGHEESVKIFEAAMKHRCPQLTELADNLPTQWSQELTDLSGKTLDMDKIISNHDHIKKIKRILSDHSNSSTASVRINPLINESLKTLTGEQKLGAIADHLVTAVKMWVPQKSFEGGKEKNYQKLATKKLIQYLSNIQ